MNIFEIIPFKGVGPFLYYNSIESYSEYILDFEKCEDKTGWDTYKYKDYLSIYTEESKIVSIACRKNCLLSNFQLIGSSFKEFLKHFEINLSEAADKIYMPNEDTFQDVYDIEKFGLQIWCDEDSIVTVFCSPAC